MTKRAKRLAKFLEKRGWTVFDGSKECKKCGHNDYGFREKCSECNAKLPKKSSDYAETIFTLEQAIQYAEKQ